MNYTFASLIPLIGGMTLAAEQVLKTKPDYIASWSSTFGANDKYALQYYDTTPYIELDELTDYSLLKYVDIVTALPPCGGLSMSNTLPRRGCHAASNIHMINSAKLALTHIKPQAMIVENAPNLFTRVGKEFADKINELANSHGYTMSLIKTSTILHGLPQERTRSFFILWKGEHVPVLEPISKPYKPFHEFMKTKFEKTNLVTNSSRTPSSDPLWKFIQSKFPNKSPQDIMSEVASKKMVSVWEIIYTNGWLAEATSTLAHEPKLGKWLAYTLNKKSQGLNILDASQKIAWHRIQALMWRIMPFLRHPYEDRWLMISEALGLMGFPDDFVKKVPIPTSESNVICQNCPVNTAADWIEEIVQALQGNRMWISPPREAGIRKILRQSNITKSGAMKPMWTV